LLLLTQNRLKHKAATLAEVFQRSSSNVEGRNGYLSLRNHELRGLDIPRKRACLTAVHNFLLTRPDGTTAAERFFGQKPRSMFAAILEAVEIPPAPLSPPRRTVGETEEYGVAGAVIEAECTIVKAAKESPQHDSDCEVVAMKQDIRCTRRL
jgi:hypothetical protein